MKGKDTCKILKEIRQKIALDNNIALITNECTYKGECKGTCPKCEAEVRYLEKELEKRRRLGKLITITGFSLCALGSSLASCQGDDGDIEVLPYYYNENLSAEENVTRENIYNNILIYSREHIIPIEDTTITTMVCVGFIVTPEGEITNITIDQAKEEISESVFGTIEQYLKEIPQELLKGLGHDCQYYIRVARNVDGSTYTVWGY